MSYETEDGLRDGLRADVDDVRLPPNVLDNAARRYHRRRTATRVAIGAATGVTAVAVVAVALVVPGATHDARHGGATSAASAPKVETVADIRPKIARALDATHAIIRTNVHNADAAATTTHKPPLANGKPQATDQSEQTNDNWFDTDTSYNTVHTYNDGKLASMSGYPIGPKGGTETDVDYPTRTYYRRPAPTFSVSTATTGKIGEPLLNTVAGIRAAVKRPDIRIVGHRKIDGREATQLRFVYTKDGESVTGDAWFDSATYVPLRANTTYGNLTQTTSFLPRTAANVARATLTVPAGFREVAPPSK